LLVVAAGGRSLAETALARDGWPRPQWWTPQIAVVATSGPWPDCPCIAAATHSLRVTAYVFRYDGTLLASNDGADRRARFEPDGAYTELPNATWSLGAG